MYAKVGEINEADALFEDIKERRGVPQLECWTIMMGAYGSMLQGDQYVFLSK